MPSAATDTTPLYRPGDIADVADRWNLTGVARGEWAGTTPDGRTVRLVAIPHLGVGVARLEVGASDEFEDFEIVFGHAAPAWSLDMHLAALLGTRVTEAAA
jgi:hypothetical protein